MRRSLVLMTTVLLTLFQVGCNPFLKPPERPPVPNYTPVGNAVLSNGSDDRPITQDEWNRLWGAQQTEHVTPIRIHGGIGP